MQPQIIHGNDPLAAGRIRLAKFQLTAEIAKAMVQGTVGEIKNHNIPPEDIVTYAVQMTDLLFETFYPKDPGEGEIISN